jgi:NAD(P)-dependent dehydrogenase (short-subunit alcohol dehydrogenase family)
MRLKGECALVTGGASGIGLATVKRFLEEGARCISLDLTPHSIPNAVSIAADLASDESIREAAAEIRRQVENPSIVVHAAATTAFATTFETDPSDIQRIFNVNIGGAFRLAREFGPAMQAAQKGSIVVLSSITGIVGAPGLSAYAASKGALITWTRTLALELAESQVRVNCVCPASIDTPLLRASFERTADPAKAREANIKRHPLGRLGTPEDVAGLILFLASSESSWITGGTYVIDGGASIARRWQE